MEAQKQVRIERKDANKLKICKTGYSSELASIDWSYQAAVTLNLANKCGFSTISAFGSKDRVVRSGIETHFPLMAMYCMLLLLSPYPVTKYCPVCPEPETRIDQVVLSMYSNDRSPERNKPGLTLHGIPAPNPPALPCVYGTFCCRCCFHAERSEAKRPSPCQFTVPTFLPLFRRDTKR